MEKEKIDSLTEKILELQDQNGCWNVLDKSHKDYPDLNYYVPVYNSTLWTLILLADIKCDPAHPRLVKPLEKISSHFLEKELYIYSIGKSHFPIPCLNGNMLYLLSYFNFEKMNIIDGLIDFFFKYQRFDDGGFKTPSSFPYHSNRSCYGTHTCYWGVVKLLKGLSFLKKEKRSKNATELLTKCIDFILLHEVCFSSHDSKNCLHKNAVKITFPNMYQSDFLEILWLLKRENVRSKKMNKALELLKSKMLEKGSWKIERRIKDLIIPVGSKNYGYELVTERAKEVLEYYG